MRSPAPATNVRADYAKRPSWMGRQPRGAACIRVTAYAFGYRINLVGGK